jgi:transposase
MILLSQSDKDALRLEQKTNKNKRVYIKVTTLLLLDEGYTPSEIGKILGISADTVNRFVKEFTEVPLSEYFTLKYSGKTGNLSTEQLTLLEAQLNEYLYLKISEIRQYVLHEFGISYSKEGMRDLLNRLGFRYKKTRTVPSKAVPEAQAAWVENFDKQLSQLADNEEVYFIDGVHPMHNTKPTFGWIKKGLDYALPANSGRQRINLNGAVCIQDPQRIFVVEADMISYESNIALFEKMIKARKGKRLIVYADNAKYNHAVKLKEWVAAHSDRIELRHLPPYSPNLNPIERLWKFMKKEVIHSNYYEKFDEFRKGVLAFFDNIENYAEQLKTLITAKFEVIG